MLFHGHGIAVITPMLADGEVDWTRLEALLNTYCSSPYVDFLCILGTTAETPTLSLAERNQVLALARHVNAGRKPLMLGAGGNCTRDVVQRVQTIDATGYDAFLIVTPYYNKPSQEGLFQHFKAVAEAATLPIILYNVPGRTGCNLQPATVKRLVDALPEKVIGIKEAAGDLEQLRALRALMPEDFNLLCGDDAITIPALQAGAVGMVSVLGGLFHEAYGALVQQIKAEDLGLKAEEPSGAPPLSPQPSALSLKLQAWCELLFKEGNPAGIKCALAQQGRIIEALRLPLVPVSAENREAIKALLQ